MKDGKMEDWLGSLTGLALGSRFRRLAEYLAGEVRQVYKATGIPLNPRHFPILSLLHQDGPLPVTQIARTIGVSHPFVSTAVKQLEKEGVLTRMAEPKDERQSIIALTPDGQRLIQQARPVWRAIGSVTDRRLEGLEGPFWEILTEAEERLTAPGLSQEILSELAK